MRTLSITMRFCFSDGHDATVTYTVNLSFFAAIGLLWEARQHPDFIAGKVV